MLTIERAKERKIKFQKTVMVLTANAYRPSRVN